MHDDPAHAAAAGLLAALEEYAAFFVRVREIVVEGAEEDELAVLAEECFGAGVDVRLALANAGEDAPAVARDVLREVYESFIVLSGIQRVADTLSLPVASCVNGDSLRRTLRAGGELATWYVEATGEPFNPPHLPGTLIARDRTSSGGFWRWSGRRPAANKDRSADEGSGKADLTQVFARRIGEAQSALADAHGDALASARRLGPVLLGFTRIAERGRGGLRAPAGAPALARVLTDALVARAAPLLDPPAELPQPGDGEIDEATAPLRAWLASAEAV
jgi:hypothetical protein